MASTAVAPSPPLSSSSSSDRAALLTSAVSFLRDPSAASSPLAQKIAFLESKGLTQPEIQTALAQAAMSGGGGAAGGAGGYAPPPQRYGAGYAPYGPQPGGMREYEKDWRDWFIMGVVGGGVGWLAVKLAQKFLLPSLQPPSESDLEASQRALEAKYDEAAALLHTLQESTDAVAASLDEQKASVEKELDEVRKAVEEMREGERKRDEWAKKVEQQVEDMAKSLPTLMDKQAAAQSSSLADLQTELKSLKSLLIARRPAGPSVGGLPSPGYGGSPVSTPGVGAGASAGAASPSLPFSIKPPGLPAWQLKGSSAAAAAPAASSTAAGSSSGGYDVPGSSAAASGEKKDSADPSASGVLVEKPQEDGAKAGEQEKKDGAEEGK
ncbi:hypothetical protein JCM10207_002606 [Rhodosporidiobolus poonsookiae]